MHDPHTAKTQATGFAVRLRQTRVLVWLIVVLERVWPVLLPLCLVVALFLSFSWLGVFRLLPDIARLLLVGLFGLAALAALFPIRRFRLPAASEIDRRIEASNRLEHAPITTQSDRLAGASADPFSQALWREHQKRMAEKLSGLHGDLPRTDIPERDPFGLRAAVALLFVVAAAYASGPYGGSVIDAFRAPVATPAMTARIDAWVTPPPYTGRAPIFLTADTNRERDGFSVPENSTVAVRISGGSGDERLNLSHGDDQREIQPDEGDGSGGALKFSHVLTDDGTVSLMDGGGELASWHFAIIRDTPPTISFAEDPRRAASGALELSYRVEDDNGVVQAEALFKLIDENDFARPLFEAPTLALRLPRKSSTDHLAKSTGDLTQHPWAGREVELKLVARDAAEQVGESEARNLTLPERRFTNSLARAVIEQRQVLALDANRKARTIALMDSALLWADETIEDPSHFLLLTAIRSRLEMATSDDALRSVVDDLWEIALIIEDGELTAAERRLRNAQEALRQALEEGATDEELQALMDELRAAMQEFMREFAERAMQNQEFAESPEGQTMTPMDLERMLDKLEDLARSGARDQAQELLSQLESLMNNLQAGQQQQGPNGHPQSEMREQMNQLGEIMRRQQELLNDTFRMDQQQDGQQGRPGQPGPGMSPEQLAEALRELQQGQGSLRQQLERLTEALEGMGIRPGEGFGEADEAMGEAEGALGEGEGRRATDEQSRALEALRQGAQDMMNQMQQAMRGEGEDGGQQGQRSGRSGRDPLGRPRATTGPDFGDSVEVPDEIDTQRAREILDAIRRRLGDALSPEIEREYLERLLNLR